MKQDDIRLGEPHAVEFEHASEAHQSWGAGRPVVKATPFELADGTAGYRARPTRGVRCRLNERLRVRTGVKIGRRRVGDGVKELPFGHVFFAPSRDVLRPWAGTLAPDEDEQRLVERERRYAEQDELIEMFSRLGLDDEAFDLNGGQVEFDRSALVKWLRRIDPVRVAEGAIREVERAHPKSQDEYEDAVEAALEEIRQGLRVTDAEIAEAFERAGAAPAPEAF